MLLFSNLPRAGQRGKGEGPRGCRRQCWDLGSQLQQGPPRVGIIQQGRGLPNGASPGLGGVLALVGVPCQKNVLQSNRCGKCGVEERFISFVPEDFSEPFFTVLEGTVSPKEGQMHLSPKSSPDPHKASLTLRPHRQAMPVPGGRKQETGCPNRTWAGTGNSHSSPRAGAGATHEGPGLPSEEHKS